MMIRRQITAPLLVVWCWLFTLGGAVEECKWEERMNVTLDNIKEPAQILREYSDVTSALDCYTKCCELEEEGCNTAQFLAFETQVICLNVKCEPFDNCVWTKYPASLGAVIMRPTDTKNNSLLAANINPDQKPATSETEPESPTTPQPNSENKPETGKNDSVTTAAPSIAEPAASQSGEKAEGGEKGNDNSDSNMSRPESNDPSNPFNPNYKPPSNEGDQDLTFGKDADDDEDDDDDFVDAQDSDLDTGNEEYYGGDGGDGGIKKYSGHVNITLSVIIGLVVCAVFVVIMVVVARRFNLFKDRSKYRRLLENPEQYSENYSASEFED